MFKTDRLKTGLILGNQTEVIKIQENQSGSGSKLMTTLVNNTAKLLAHLTEEPKVPGSIPDPAIYFRFSFR